MRNDKRIPQEAWIIKFGSPRLKKALALGLLDVSQGVYRDELVGQAFPGWLCGMGAKFSPTLNPHMREMEILEKIRETTPDAALEKLLRGERWVPVVTMWRPVRDIGPPGEPVKLFRYVNLIHLYHHTGEAPDFPPVT